MLLVHGGPRLHDTWGYNPQVQLLANRGYADPDRIGIMGGSYGGCAALAAIALAPDRFATAVDYVGVPDLVSFLRTLPPYLLATDEGHGFDNTENQIRLHHAIDSHVARHLGAGRPITT